MVFSILGLGSKTSTAPDTSQTETARPDGTLLWFHCRNSRDLEHARTVARQIMDEREDISFLFTGTGHEPMENSDGTVFIREIDSSSRRAIRSFLTHWSPNGLLWMGGGVDPMLLTEVEAKSIPRYLIDLVADKLKPETATWLPTRRKSILRKFSRILTVDEVSADRVIKWGALEPCVESIGTFDQETPLLSCHENERSYLAETIGTRPVWLAASTPLSEVSAIVEAHKQACKRSHRLLLILVPNEIGAAAAMLDILQSEGIETVMRSEGDPEETTRALIADIGGELGMWYRLAPVTYMGGTLTNGTRHPYEAAALGSAVVHGPQTAPYSNVYAQLDGTGGAKLIRNGRGLGPAIETLLSPDKAAQVAHAAWQVTSQGAEVTNRVCELVYEIADRTRSNYARS